MRGTPCFSCLQGRRTLRSLYCSGFSFYIQFHNAEKRGTDFRGRFAWRMCLLFLFAQLHALFYNGDILLLYAVVGFALIPVCKLKDKAVFWIAVILLLQPYEWGRAIYAMINPEYVPVTGHYIPFAKLAEEVTATGSFFEVLRSNITDGQLYSNIWQVENGRLFQTAALFMFGMLLGRRKYFMEKRRVPALLEEDADRCCNRFYSSPLSEGVCS